MRNDTVIKLFKKTIQDSRNDYIWIWTGLAIFYILLEGIINISRGISLGNPIFVIIGLVAPTIIAVGLFSAVLFRLSRDKPFDYEDHYEEILYGKTNP